MEKVTSYSGQPLEQAKRNLTENVKAVRKIEGSADAYDMSHEQSIERISQKAHELQIKSERLGERLGELKNLWLEIKNADGSRLDDAVDAYVEEIADIQARLEELENKRKQMGAQEQHHPSNERRLLAESNQNIFAHIDAQDTQKWGKLLNTIRKTGGLQGSRKFYTTDELISIINKVRRGETSAETVTGSSGLYETVVQFLQADAGTNSQETGETESFDAKTSTDFSEFQDFALRHQTSLDKKNGDDLQSEIYDKFYTEDSENRAYQENTQFRAVKKEYDTRAEKVLEKFLALSEKYAQEAKPPIKPGKQSIENGWVYFMVNGGASKNKEAKIGRLYLNIKPERAVQFYEEALPRLFHNQVAVDAKIPREGTPGAFNRSDKMVIYFDEAEEQKVLDTIQSLYADHQHYFIPETPRFTAEITDDSGFVMNGIGFGEEPKQADESFGLMRSQILADVYTTAKKENWKLSDPQVKQEFGRMCKKYGVDPTSAAFNAGEEHFKLMRRRKNEVRPNSKKRAA